MRASLEVRRGFSKRCASCAEGFGWYYSHPFSRLICILATLPLTILLFSEDPQTYSNAKASVPLVGTAFNHAFGGYPDASLNPKWLALKIAMLVVFPTAFAAMGEFFVRRFIFQSLLGLSGFKRNKGVLACAALSVFFGIWTSANVYDALVSNAGDPALFFLNGAVSKEDFANFSETTTTRTPESKSSCDDGEPPFALYDRNSVRWKAIKKDVERGLSTNVLPLANCTFSALALYAAVLGICYTIFATLDAVLQDKNNYGDCCRFLKTSCWPRSRIPFFWTYVLVCAVLVSSHGYYVLAHGGGYLYWQGELRAATDRDGTDGAAKELVNECAPSSGGEGEKCHRRLLTFWPRLRRRPDENLSDGGTEPEIKRDALRGGTWFSDYHLAEESDLSAFRNCTKEKFSPWDFGIRLRNGTATLIRSDFDDLEESKEEMKVFFDNFYDEEKRVPLPSELADDDDDDGHFSEIKSDGVMPRARFEDAAVVLSKIAKRSFPSRGFFGTSEIQRIVLASIILVLNLIVVTQDVIYPHYRSEEETYGGLVRGSTRGLRHPTAINVPGLSTEDVEFPSLFAYFRRRVTEEGEEAEKEPDPVPLESEDFVYLEREKPKKEKKRYKFVTARWLMYTVIFATAGLDVVCLSSQFSYFPESYGQVIDESGYVHSLANFPSSNSSETTTNDEEEFVYDVLETVCPVRAKRACVKEEGCSEDPVSGKKVSETASPDAVVDWAVWRGYFGLDEIDFLLTYRSEFPATAVAYESYLDARAEIVVPATDAESSCGPSGPIWDEYERRSSGGRNSTSVPGDVHVFRGKSCSCRKVYVLKVDGFTENLGCLSKAGVSVRQLRPKKRPIVVAESSSGGLEAVCPSGRPLRFVYPFGRPDGLRRTDLFCDGALFYEMKMGHAEFLRILEETGRNVDSVGSVLDALGSAIWASSGDPEDSVSNCISCKRETVASLRNSRRVAGADFSPRHREIFEKGRKCLSSENPVGGGVFVFDEPCAAASSGGNDSFVRNGAADMKIRGYGCAVATGALNVRFLGSSYASKAWASVPAIAFLAAVVARIAVDYAYETLLKWKSKYDLDREEDLDRPLGNEEKLKKKRRCGKFKNCTLRCCLFVHCEKERFVENYKIL